MNKKIINDTDITGLSNPYIEGRREWNDRYGDFIVAARQWKMTAMISLVISVMCVGGLIYFGSQNHVVPYVVEVDKLGSSFAVNRADKADVPDSRVIRAQLARWIADVRSVYTDAEAENKIILEAYSIINKHGAGYNALNEYFRANDPFKRAVEQSVSVTVHSVLPLSDKTWRVEWEESIRGHNGQIISSNQWQAVITILISPPHDEDVLFTNPLGIYVDSFSWSKRI